MSTPVSNKIALFIDGANLYATAKTLGFDIDFAPVLDVHTNPANPIIGDRAFGRTAATVTRRALACAEGLAAAGMLACGKHFPGHGFVKADSEFAGRAVTAWQNLGFQLIIGAPVGQVNALEPDLVAITGDLVDGRVAELAPHAASLQQLYLDRLRDARGAA